MSHPPSLQVRVRLLVALLLAAALAACASTGPAGALFADRVVFTVPQLQASLDRRYPREFDTLGGLVTLSLRNPRLSIPPGSQRLRLEFDIGIGGLGRDPRVPAGYFTLDSALRYDPATRGLHLDAPELRDVRVDALGGRMNDRVREAVNRWLARHAREEPVHTLDDGLLARLAQRRIGRIAIGDGVVTLHLDQ
ncbi:DUF1439 domain-containing protein [Vulcaniibacterium gelatinicum]|uniref:DUF1439 domain-containing protein n=1 Tax=Vulcaniibacterium gelatinicum TaxID=2598725 RepID=UPI0015F2C45F|nr:DUF1439 domain-containing protein [Vulcaniibacterium gelatinicum]